MKIQWVTFGDFKSQPCADLAARYQKLLSRYVSTESIVLSGVNKEPALVRWLKDQSSRTHLIFLDERGKTFTSPAFSQYLDKIFSHGSAPSITIILGDDTGFSEPMRKRAALLWSLSSMTYPHELAAVMAMEQCYRAMSILRGHPYHRG